MTDIRWNLLQPVDVGQRFQEGFQFAQQNALRQQENAYRQEERERASQLRNALTGSINPQTGAVDRGAMRQAYLGAGDPEGAMRVDTQAAQQQAGALEQHRERIMFGAGLIEQFRPADDAGWQRVLAAMQQAGHDISDIPPTFNPQYVEGVVNIARASRPPQTQTPPNIQREVDYYRSIGRDDQAEQLLTRHAEGGPILANNGDGTFTLIPRPSAGGRPSQPPPPRQGEVRNGRPYLGGDPASPSSWGPRQGGPTQSGSGTFR